MTSKKYLITIVVGHTEKAQGAQAIAPLKKTEYAYNSELSMMLADDLSLMFNVYVAFRDGLGIAGTYGELEKMNPDANIELHFNSSADPKAKGTEVLCSYNSKEFAHAIQNKLCDKLKRAGPTNRGVKVIEPTDRGYASISKLKCPNVLIEPFFGSNKEDAELGLNSQHLISEALYEALINWFYRRLT